MYACASKECLCNDLSKVSFFTFPDDIGRCTMWAEFCGILPTLQEYYKLGYTTLPKHFKICNQHFEKSMFYGPKKNRLRPEAIPTLYVNKRNSSSPSMEVSTKEELEENAEPEFIDCSGAGIISLNEQIGMVNLLNDHSYALLIPTSPPLSTNASENEGILRRLLEEKKSEENSCDENTEEEKNYFGIEDDVLSVIDISPQEQNYKVEDDKEDVVSAVQVPFHEQSAVNVRPQDEQKQMLAIYKYFDKICRICLSCSNLVHVPELNKNISELTKIKVPEEKFPQQVCFQCLQQLRSVLSFIDKINSSADHLKEVIEFVERTNEMMDEYRNETAGAVEDKNYKSDIEIVEHTLSDVETKNDQPVSENVEESGKEIAGEGERIKNGIAKKRQRLKKKTKQKPQVPENSQIECSKCKKIFTEKHEYRTHTCDIEKLPNLCHICGKLICFLRAHLETHSEDLTYVCDFCNVTMRSRITYRRHLREKHGDREYLCEHCPKSFCRRSGYEKHRKIHLGIKHTCSTCGKKYGTREGLRDHSNLHTGKKPWKCKLCGASYAMRSAYYGHVEKWHRDENEEPQVFQCHLCSKLFRTKRNLKNHVRRHTVKKEKLGN